ncbi:oxidoreductase [Fundicoccus culcitae]|uniref:NADH-dependent flavin oxidoreductase n=1 Tax=Fundicoccus culcitae TaxID=2969821 RepID=A0ABY5P3N2_9LACT|nr:NADH-dependent flavin oxidoreductase [Fundicoccus culcitae]UUX33337.1 NADH-dependent flavin oxidoreductase [Fundicoccus culcitae]
MGKANHSIQLKENFVLKNRLMMAPMTTSSAESNGAISKEDLDFFEYYSKGFSAVIVGSQSVSILGTGFDKGWNIYDQEVDESLQELAEVIHKCDAKAILQLYHAGRLAEPSFIRNHQPVAPSEVPIARSFASFPRQLSNLEIEQIIDDFCNATLKAIKLGFDGVEIHGANTYLVQQFFSPHSNRRTDKWGGTFEKRTRFIRELITHMNRVIEKYTNKNFILGFRFSPEEYETPGIRMNDTLKLLKILDEMPLDYFHLSLSDYNKESLDGVPIIKSINSLKLSTTLIGCGGVRNKSNVDQLLDSVPLVSVANASIIDSEWPLKILNNNDKIKEKNLISELDSLRLPSGIKKMMLDYPNLYLVND